jgi:hypothetical protein
MLEYAHVRHPYERTGHEYGYQVLVKWISETCNLIVSGLILLQCVANCYDSALSYSFYI